MLLHNLLGTEDHPIYNGLAAENLSRQYSFLRSITLASLSVGQPLLSIEVLKSLNYHAISCLHPGAGEFRPCPVDVGDFKPPPHYQVPSLMQMFTNDVNRRWENADPVSLAAFVLWKLNHIHPFINGNGRTARAACHFVLCLKMEGWIAGAPILPELIRGNRERYIACLRQVDQSAIAGKADLKPLHALLEELLTQQIASAMPPAPASASL